MAKVIAGLTRVQFFALAAVACIACALPVYFLTGGGGSASSDKELSELLFVPPTPVQNRLYSGATDPTTGAPVVPYESGIEVMTGEGIVPSTRYLTYKDGSLEAIELQADGALPRVSRLFYPRQAGEDGLRLRQATVYAADGREVVEQTIFRATGTRQQHTTAKIEARVLPLGKSTHALTKKWKWVTDFADDGKTTVGEQYFFKDEFTEYVLTKEQRWLADAAHTLVYLNVFKSDDKSRTITEFDLNGQVVKLTVIQMNNHSVAKAYYPGGVKLRLEASSDYTTNTVTFYRVDGTKERIEELGPSSVEITYLDKTGTNATGKQHWWHNEQGLTSGKPEAVTGLYYLYELDAKGKEIRSIYYHGGKMRRDSRENYTTGGIIYVQAEWLFDDNEFLKEANFYLKARKDPPAKAEKHTPEEKIGANFVEPSLLVLPPREPGLVIPILQTGYP